jgi:ketosteroid isomerase-like protein
VLKKKLPSDRLVDYPAAMTSGEEQVRSVVADYFRCLNTENWVRMREIWHPLGELKAVGARPRNGHDEVIGYFSRLFRPWPKHEDIATRVIVAGDVATAEVRFEGTTHGGRSVAFEAVDVFDAYGGLIRKLSNWYDLDHVRRTLAED